MEYNKEGAMKLVIPIKNLSQLIQAKEANVDEVIIGIKDFSRFGNCSVEQAIQLAEQAKNWSIRTCFDWDVLSVNKKHSQLIEKFKTLKLDSFDAIRVQDPGSLYFVLNETKFPIQFITEMGNHNLCGLKKWKDYIGPRLERLILSIELNKEKLETYIKELEVDIEYYSLGRILLFYSPRSLLKHYLVDHDDQESQKMLSDDFIELTGSSEESPHKGFPLLENQHGTFMFSTKDFCIVENYNELKQIGISHTRVDLSHLKDWSILSKIKSLCNHFETDLAKEVKSSYPNVSIRGYFLANKSDVLFDKLKNTYNTRMDKNYIGDVLEVSKDKHIALLIKSTKLNLKKGDRILYRTPDKKFKEYVIQDMKNSKLNNINEATKDEIVILPHTSSVSSNTRVYIKVEDETR